jgi:hypothetical protein
MTVQHHPRPLWGSGIHLLNNTWCEAVDDIPIHMSMGSTNDISPLLCFHFWDLSTTSLMTVTFCLSHVRNVDISSVSARHAITLKVLMDDTLKVIHQSNVRLALNPHAKNF